MPATRSAHDLHEEKWFCECANQIYVFKIFNNGTKHFGTECLRCGKWRSIKKDDVPFKERHGIGEYMPEIAIKFRDEKNKDFTNSVDEVRREEYCQQQRARIEYYETEAWKRKTKLRLRLNQNLFNGCCEQCFENKAVVCHHTTYERLYEEWIFDLAAVCAACHESWHAKNPLWSGHLK